MPRDIISLDDITPNNLGTFKKINQVTLPCHYGDNWYQDSLNSDQIVKLAYYSELPVGCIKAKAINTNPNDLNNFELISNQKLAPKLIPNMVYLESLSVLSSYRNLGIGNRLLNHLIDETKNKFIHEIVLHVHVENKEAIEWYKRHGFEQKDLIKDYYKNQQLNNPDAYILSIKI